MRLICPNCGAQYEVPEGAVPETGRDVECSNCGHSWFERRTTGVSGDEDALPSGEEEPPAIEEPRAPAPPEDEPEPLPSGATTPRPDRPRRRELDPQVASVLQAERDLAARRRAEREAQSFESQPDLALEQAPEDRRARREERLAEVEDPAPFEFLPSGQDWHPETEQTAPSAPEPTAPAAEEETPAQQDEDDAHREPTPAERAAAAEGLQRRELLPDIDTINSSLQPRQGSATAKRWQVQTSAAEQREQRRRGGFRIGFLTVVLVALLATVVYGQADRIAQAVPAASPALQDYVETVNAGRLWLDLHLQDVLAQLETLGQE